MSVAGHAFPVYKHVLCLAPQLVSKQLCFSAGHASEGEQRITWPVQASALAHRHSAPSIHPTGVGAGRVGAGRALEFSQLYLHTLTECCLSIKASNTSCTLDTSLD